MAIKDTKVVTGVNTSYASDKRWGEKVYKWMTYFYNKL